jgi:hypothetical protein
MRLQRSWSSSTFEQVTDRKSRSPGRRRRSALIGTIAAAGLCVAGLAITPGIAKATAGAYCGTYGSGNSGDVTDGIVNVWTTWTKKPPGCHDLNLVSVAKADSYEGWYEDTSQVWHPGSAGFVYHGTSTSDVVLLTAVATGTQMTVAEQHGFDNFVAINY